MPAKRNSAKTQSSVEKKSTAKTQGSKAAPAGATADASRSTTEHEGRIVVGVDGSPCSRAALRWAAAEARYRDAVLEVVRVWHIPMSVPPRVSDESVAETQAAETEAVDFDIFDELGDHEGLEVVRLVANGPAATTLVEAAHDADLLVVGTRGHGIISSALLGSISSYCVQHSVCPVVVIPVGADVP